MIGTWIALTDQILENDWFWYTTLQTLKETGYSNWQPGEPNNYGSGENCAMFWGGFGWWDSGCHQEQKLICENQP